MAFNPAGRPRKLGRYETAVEVGKAPLGPLFVAVREEAPRTAFLRLIDTADLPNDGLDRLSEAGWWALDVRSPHVLAACDVVLGDGQLGIASEYVEAENLRALWRLAAFKKQPASLAIALSVVLDLAAGVRALEQQAEPVSGGAGGTLANGNLGADHVVLGVDGVARIADAGVLSAARQLERFSGSLEMTQYSSPEQLRGERCTSRSDVFVLGVLFWELLSGGKHLFIGSNPAALRDRILSKDVPRLEQGGFGKLPGAVSDVLAKALYRSDGDRFESVEAFIAAVEGLGERAAPEVVGKWVRDINGTSFGMRAKQIERALSPSPVTSLSPRPGMRSEPQVSALAAARAAATPKPADVAAPAAPEKTAPIAKAPAAPKAEAPPPTLSHTPESPRAASKPAVKPAAGAIGAAAAGAAQPAALAAAPSAAAAPKVRDEFPSEEIDLVPEPASSSEPDSHGFESLSEEELEPVSAASDSLNPFEGMDDDARARDVHDDIVSSVRPEMLRASSAPNKPAPVEVPIDMDEPVSSPSPGDDVFALNRLEPASSAGMAAPAPASAPARAAMEDGPASLPAPPLREAPSGPVPRKWLVGGAAALACVLGLAWALTRSSTADPGPGATPETSAEAAVSPARAALPSATEPSASAAAAPSGPTPSEPKPSEPKVPEPVATAKPAAAAPKSSAPAPAVRTSTTKSVVSKPATKTTTTTKTAAKTPVKTVAKTPTKATTTKKPTTTTKTVAKKRTFVPDGI